MIQSSWVPVLCHRTKPAPATAAADFIAIDDQSTERYLCKGQSKHSLLPATEWICAHIAKAAGLPVPPFNIVEVVGRPDELFFGSRWQGGSIDYFEAMGRISNPSVFAKTHAVDLFTHNIDRHPNNYLYLSLAGDVVARVIDFSHAWFTSGWPLPSLPMAPCHSTFHLPALLKQDKDPYVRPMAVIDAIRGLPNDWLEQVLSAMPDQWLDAATRQDVTHWWANSGRAARLSSAQSHLP